MPVTNLECVNALNVARGTAHAAFTPYVGLLKVLPDATGAGLTEVTDANYARQLASFGAPAPLKADGTDASAALGLAVKWVSANTAALGFGGLGFAAAPGTIVGYGIWDAASGGNLREFAPLTDASGTVVTKTPSAGDTFSFPVGKVVRTAGQIL